MILLNLKQLCKFGMHLGHTYKQSIFFSGWMWMGWRKNIFLFNLVISLFMLRVALNILQKLIKFKRPIWFIEQNGEFSVIVARYAYMCGEVFTPFRWINGILTNFKSIILSSNFLINMVFKDKYIFRYSDKKKLGSYVGYIFARKRLPGLAILPSVSKNENAVGEFAKSDIFSVGVVDSNVLSNDVSFPVPGNDDSFLCINYYCFLFSKYIIIYKMKFINSWKKLRNEKTSVKSKLFLLKNKFMGNNILIKTKYNNNYYLLRKNFISNSIIYRWYYD